MHSSINWPEKNDSFNYIITNLAIEKNVNEGNEHATTHSLIGSMHVRMIIPTLTMKTSSQALSEKNNNMDERMTFKSFNLFYFFFLPSPLNVPYLLFFFQFFFFSPRERCVCTLMSWFLGSRRKT
jgi:hypothetical protein